MTKSPYSYIGLSIGDMFLINDKENNNVYLKVTRSSLQGNLDKNHNNIDVSTNCPSNIPENELVDCNENDKNKNDDNNN